MISKKYQSCHFYDVAFPQPEMCIAKAACSKSSRALLLWLAGKCLDFFSFLGVWDFFFFFQIYISENRIRMNSQLAQCEFANQA